MSLTRVSLRLTWRELTYKDDTLDKQIDKVLTALATEYRSRIRHTGEYSAMVNDTYRRLAEELERMVEEKV